MSALSTSALALVVLIAGAVVGLLTFEARHQRKGALACKTVASMGFVALALVRGAAGHGASASAHAILIGLVIAVCGDVVLAVPSRLSFLIGLFLFFAAQSAYIVAFAILSPIQSWGAPVAGIAIAVTLAVYVWLSPHLGRMRGPVLMYMSTSTLMNIGALAAFRANRSGAACFLAGTILFYVSDLSVARNRFVKKAYINLVWGLPAYYLGQTLIAWATGAE